MATATVSKETATPPVPAVPKIVSAAPTPEPVDPVQTEETRGDRFVLTFLLGCAALAISLELIEIAQALLIR